MGTLLTKSVLVTLLKSGIFGGRPRVNATFWHVSGGMTIGSQWLGMALVFAGQMYF